MAMRRPSAPIASEPPSDTDRPLFLRRLRFGLWICLCVYLLFGLYILDEPGLSSSTRSAIATMRFACAAVFGAALIALRMPWRIRPVPLGVLCIALVAVSSGASGVLLPRDNALVPMSFVVQSLFTAALVPWGVGAQLAVVLVQAAALATNTYLVGGSFAGLGEPLPVLTFVSFAVSLVHRLRVHVVSGRHRGARTRAQPGGRRAAPQ